jgi:hypothetical protein
VPRPLPTAAAKKLTGGRAVDVPDVTAELTARRRRAGGLVRELPLELHM